MAEMTTSLDTFLWYLLYYKIILVTLMSIPLPWLFGIKKPLLRWVSKSLIVRVYMRVAPTTSFLLALYLSYQYSSSQLTSGPMFELLQARAYLGWFNTLFFFLIRRLYELVRGDPEPLFAVERDALRRDMLNFKPLPLWLLSGLTFFWRLVNPPCLKGIENLPKDKKKLIFVSNHALWALDSPLLFYSLYKETGIYIRGLAEHFWFVIPLLGELTFAMGGIDGTRENCELLMKQDHNLLVYPGGAREAFRKKSEAKYEMVWGNHLGFARLAIKHGYTLVPVSSVGTEDFWTILFDVPVGWLMRAGKHGGTGGKKLTAPFILPQPWNFQKIYHRIGEPISTAEFNGDFENEEYLIKVRDLAQQRIQQGIQTLIKEREFDENRYVFKGSKPSPLSEKKEN